MQEVFGQQRANEIQSSLGSGTVNSLVAFYLRSGMSASEFEQIEDDLCMTNSAYVEGLVNINTASEPVLACIPGIGYDNARQVVAYRQSNQGQLVRWRG